MADKERYFASFNGTNELDIKVRGDKRDVKPGQAAAAATAAGVQSSPQLSHTYSSATVKLNKSAAASQLVNAQNSVAAGRR